MESIFSNLFPAASKNAWLAQVQKELKSDRTGDHLPEGLRWSTDDGFTLDPYYTADDLNEIPLNIIQVAQKQQPGWLNAPDYTLTDDSKADNGILHEARTRGADALIVTFYPKPDQYAGAESVSRLLNGIKLSDTPVFFRPVSKAATFNVSDFVQVVKTVAPYQLKGGLLTAVDESTAEATRLTADSPLFRTICIGSHDFHNAGATATQELAFTLARLADAYDQLTEPSLTGPGLSVDQLVSKTILSVSVGTSYFVEIAKLRALRVLFRRLLSYYPATGIYSPFIHAQTSSFYNTAATPYTNLLRATTEAMAAVMGGCDMLTVYPYDSVLGPSATTTDREFPERIARNVSVLLKEESYLDKVADPSAGSYYIENLTHQLTETAWTLFLDIEKRGGYKRAFADGFVASEIEQSYQRKVEAIRNGKVIVGVTKFRSDEIPTSPDRLSVEKQVGLLPDQRLAGAFE